MKPMDFRGKWVLVTGASSGLGKSMAGVFAREHGANVILEGSSEPNRWHIVVARTRSRERAQL
jgi:NAD(P)-dependent dehydrogenase (short-subunit alcohol dehydrogenase family)